MKKEAVVDGSVMRPICSATAGTISAMCTLAPKKPYLYTCPAQELNSLCAIKSSVLESEIA